MACLLPPRSAPPASLQVVLTPLGRTASGATSGGGTPLSEAGDVLATHSKVLQQSRVGKKVGCSFRLSAAAPAFVPKSRR